MSKLDDAQAILRGFGLPPEQCNEISGYALLALSGVKKHSRWRSAKRESMRIHDILLRMRERYGKEYAENTRETVRRRVLHQLEQARIADKNPDAPGLPTNSPRTHYALTEEALEVIHNYGTSEYEAQLQAFREEQGSLLDLYRRRRKQRMVPVKLPSGESLALSPGRHNVLQAAVLEEFAPRFVPGATVLYFGDTAKKDIHVAADMLRKLGFPVSKHDKLPDIVLFTPGSKSLFLIEAVTSHGPVTPKRYTELEGLLEGSPARRVYVSAFPDFAEFKRHIESIAWETEVWIAEIPDHLIHFNGDKFLT